MSMPNSESAANRQLLYGVLALRLNFITRAELLLSLQAWYADPSRPLSVVMVERQALAPRRQALLDEVVREYLLQYNMDPEQSLSAACAAQRIPLDLNLLSQTAQRASMATLPSSSTVEERLGRALTEPEEPAPETPRRFQVIRPHASGALGEVFLAHDNELNREVALKQIQAAYANHPDSRARFLLEAEITGSLEHPGVVPVYSLGHYEDGRPFYAMRFIRGQSLLEAIQQFHDADRPGRHPSERALALRGLLRRFVDVCNAVAYAHSRGVIHRDIKPANIMLGEYGETLVVDWGLAKAFNQPITHDSIELPLHPSTSGSTQATMLGQAVGTPAFMPPEQAAGRIDQIGPPSDIYSLGATLYNLLTGLPPFIGHANEVIRLVQRCEFMPPRKANPLVPAPLEAIILRAMALNPEERYPSVNELAQEVERWLADEPVLAYRESLLEQTQRWTRRHRPLVYGLGALLVTAVVGLAGGLFAVNVEQTRTAQQRDLAESNLELAMKAVDQCFVIATRDPLLQQDRMRGVRKLLLAQALEFYENFRVKRPDDPSIQMELGKNAFRVALITEEVGAKARAIESYERAREMLDILVVEQPDNLELQADLARILNNLGTLQRDTNHPGATESLSRALKYREALAQVQPSSAEAQSELASTCNNLGVLLRDQDRPREAQKYFLQARGILETLTQKPGHEDRYAAQLAATYNNLAGLLAEIEDGDAARKAYERALQLCELLVEKDPRQSNARADLARTLLHLGALLHAETPDRARAYYERARTLAEELVRDFPEVFEYRADLARACDDLGVLLPKPAQVEEAIRLHLRAIDLLDRLIREHGDITDYQLSLAGACVNLANTYRDAERTAEALPWYARALARTDELHRKQEQWPALRRLRRNALWGRGDALVKLRKGAEALADLDLALKLAVPGERDHDLIRRSRAFALALAGKHSQAAAEVDALARNAGDNRGELLYDLACVAALAAKAAAVDPALDATQRTRQTNDLAGRAVDLLTRAQLARFFQDPDHVAQLRQDRDFDFLRNREEFRKFLQQFDPK
ncbi:MAG: serine/threonine-protein kinase [Gemmataceae bacterium]